MTAATATLPMYDFPELSRAHERFLERADARLREAGLADASFTQMCGYPLVTSRAGAHDAIAAPVYDVPFCRGATHRALVVVADDSAYRQIADLRGARFARNAPDSNTGTNLPRALFAPLAVDGRFFRSVVTTGSHVASLRAVSDGEADVASIDNVTYALLAEHRPTAVANLRVLATTAPSPTLPFVTSPGIGEAERAALFGALASAIADIQGTYAAEALRLTGIRRASLATYLPLRDLEHDAVASYEDFG